jgi:hypothetical protein
MIRSKPKFEGLEGDALTAARLADLDERLFHYELAQSKNWSFAADARGQELEARQTALAEALDDLAGQLAGVPDVIEDSTRLERLETLTAWLISERAEFDRFRSQALELIEALAVTAGYQRWDGDFTTWPAWYEHLTGHRPQ